MSFEFRPTYVVVIHQTNFLLSEDDRLYLVFVSPILSFCFSLCLAHLIQYTNFTPLKRMGKELVVLLFLSMRVVVLVSQLIVLQPRSCSMSSKRWLSRVNMPAVEAVLIQRCIEITVHYCWSFVLKVFSVNFYWIEFGYLWSMNLFTV